MRARRYLGCTKKELLSALESLNQQEAEEFTVTNMLSDEYDALITPANFPKGADFVTRHLTKEWLDYLEGSIADLGSNLISAKLIDRLVAVDRLRVIEVF